MGNGSMVMVVVVVVDDENGSGSMVLSLSIAVDTESQRIQKEVAFTNHSKMHYFSSLLFTVVLNSAKLATADDANRTVKESSCNKEAKKPDHTPGKESDSKEMSE